MNKYLEFKDGTSYKFWRIELDGASFTVNFGKVGTAGQTQTKTFDDEDAAKKEAVKLLNSKLKKGYAETGSPIATSKAAALTTKRSTATEAPPKPRSTQTNSPRRSYLRKQTR